MRKRHLDEQPQLWQVVKGQMSLAGMRAEDAVARRVMDQERSADADALHRAYELEAPSMSNLVHILMPNYAGNLDANYHINMLWSRKASLGFTLYVGFRFIANRFLQTGVRK